MFITNRTKTVVLFATLIFAWGVNKLFAVQAPAVSVSWRVTDDRLTLNEPVLLQMVVDNHSADVVDLNLGADFSEGLLITIVTPEGATVRTPPKEASGAQRIGKTRIAPGTTYTHEFVVDDWYQFKAPGKYTIRARLKYPITAGRQLVPAEETSQVVTIDERDAAALRRRCEALTTRILDSNSVDDAITAGRALSSVRDPIAVPFLVRSLESPILTAQDIVMYALGTFSTAEAVDALIPIARGNSPHASWARMTLLQTAQKVQDRDLRQYIYRALREPEPR